MKKIILCSVLLLVTMFSQATDRLQDHGSIKGKITTNDGKIATNVTVKLVNTNRITQTDGEGYFSFSNLKYGEYVIHMSSVLSYKNTDQRVFVDKSVVNVSLVLNISAHELEEINVFKFREKLINKESEYVARMPLKNMENPQTYSVVTKELMQQQIITDFSDVTKNVPGVVKLWNPTGKADDGSAKFAIRGFQASPTMVNGITTRTNGGLDPANIENVEIIKGPSATLFGGTSTDYGGIINIVTKKPFDSTSTTVSYTGGNYNLSRLTVDFNKPLNDNKTVLFRINTAYNYIGSFKDAGYRRTFFVAPSLSYKLNSKLSVLLNAEYYRSNGTNATALFISRRKPTVVSNAEDLSAPYNRSYTSNDVTIANTNFNTYAQVNYKISDEWLSQTNIASNSRRTDGYNGYLDVNPSNTSLTRGFRKENADAQNTSIQQNFIGDFKIASMRNRLLFGLDFFSSKRTNNNSDWIDFDEVSTVGPDVKYAQLNELTLGDAFAKSALSDGYNPYRTTEKQRTYSAYISNVLNVTPQFIVMLSLRADRFINLGIYNAVKDETSGTFDQNTVSPKLGLLYQIINNKISVYANYMNGFKNVDGVKFDKTTFIPEQANQFEGGFKFNLLDNKLSANISYYNIGVKNIKRADPVNNGFSIQNGNVVSKGFEAEVITNPLTGLSIIAGYSYNNNKINESDLTVLGRRSVEAGPAHLANFWISYAQPIGILKGLGLGFGGNYASENLTINNTLAGIFTLPAYMVFDAAAFYNLDKYRIGIKLDNIANKKYWRGWTMAEAQMPRFFSLQLAVKF